MKPVVSVIIPTYNRARDLERALKSVIAQTRSCWEIIVIDNHSSDGTDAIISNMNDVRIRLFKIHNDGVIAASRNLGIRYAQGEYVAFLDSDDWWLPKKIEESLKYLEKGADVVYHDLFLATKRGQDFFWKKVRTRNLSNPVFDDLIVNGNGLLNSSVVVKKVFLNEIKGLSEDKCLIASEDYDAWLKISKMTNRFKRIPKVLGYYWVGGGNTNNPDRTIKGIDAIMDSHASAVQERDAYWAYYARGKIFYGRGRYEMARQSFRRIHLSRTSCLIYLKSRWLLCLNGLHHSFHGYDL